MHFLPFPSSSQVPPFMHGLGLQGFTMTTRMKVNVENATAQSNGLLQRSTNEAAEWVQKVVYISASTCSMNEHMHE